MQYTKSKNNIFSTPMGCVFHTSYIAYDTWSDQLKL